MAYAINGGDIIEYTVQMRYEGQRLLNVWHYKYKDGQTAITDGGAAFLAFLADQATDVTSVYSCTKAAVTSDLTFEGIRAQVIYPTRRAYTFWVTGQAGDRVTGGLPVGCAACLLLTQDTAGRGRTGRKEIPGMLKDDEAEGLFAPSPLALVNSIGQAHLTEIPLAGPGKLLEPVIFNRDNPILSRRVTGYGARPEVRYLVRRTVGRGE